MIPYDVEMVTVILRNMPDDRLAAVGLHDFQRYPVAKIAPAGIVKELIANERVRRRK